MTSHYFRFDCERRGVNRANRNLQTISELLKDAVKMF